MNLPEEVLLAAHVDDSTHVFLKVLIGSKWIDLDATWDSAVGRALHVNQWDVETSTSIAVPMIERFSLEKSNEIMEQENSQDVTNDLVVNSLFYQVFNQWLAKIRKG